MFRIDTPNNVVVMPAPAAPGVPGYAQDTDPAGATSLSADWTNAIQESLCLTVEHVMPLNKGDVTQFTEVVKGAAAVRSAAVAMVGLQSSHHVASLVASTQSQAGAADSAVIASDGGYAMGMESAVVASIDTAVPGEDPRALGDRSIVAACVGLCEAVGSPSALLACSGTAAGESTVLGAHGAVAGADNGIVSGDRSVLLASHHAECTENDTVAGGVGGAAVNAAMANQNLTWKDNSATGDRWGAALHAGDANAGTDTIRLDGTTGKAGIDGGIVLPNAGNKVARTFTVPANIAGDATQQWADGNTTVVATSIILWSFQAPGGQQLAQGQAIPTAGVATFELRNSDPAAVYLANVTISYIVINPA